MSKPAFVFAVIIGVGSILLLSSPVQPRYRTAPLWMRAALVLAGLFGITSAILQLYLVEHEGRTGHTQPRRARFSALDHLREDVAMIGLGILICLILNPEFWKRGRKAAVTSNKSLEPTAEPGA